MRKQQLFYSVYRSVYRLFRITYGEPIKKSSLGIITLT